VAVPDKKRLLFSKGINFLLKAFFGGLVALSLLVPLAFSIYLDDYSIFLDTLGILVLVILGVAVGGLFLGITMTPLIWLLSVVASRGTEKKG
jgi:hypothetical protein